MSYLETVLKYELQTQKVHILKNSKVMLFLFSEAPNLKLNISRLAVIFINNQAKIHIKSSFLIQCN